MRPKNRKGTYGLQDYQVTIDPTPARESIGDYAVIKHEVGPKGENRLSIRRLETLQDHFNLVISELPANAAIEPQYPQMI
jgi:hypothetical protein